MSYQELRQRLDRIADDLADGQDITDRLDVADREMVEAWGELTSRQSRDLFASVEELRGKLLGLQG